MQLNQESDLPDTTTLSPLTEEITFGAVLDIRNVEHEITELMIRRACEQMEGEQQFPFCSDGLEGTSNPRMRRAG